MEIASRFVLGDLMMNGTYNTSGYLGRSWLQLPLDSEGDKLFGVTLLNAVLMTKINIDEAACQEDEPELHGLAIPYFMMACLQSLRILTKSVRQSCFLSWSLSIWILSLLCKASCLPVLVMLSVLRIEYYCMDNSLIPIHTHKI